MGRRSSIQVEVFYFEVEMDRFVSMFTNRLDAKGRVSVPSSFRAVLAREGFEGVFCYPSLDADALDAGGEPLISQIHGLLDKLDPYSDERDHLSIALFGVSEVLRIDSDGRIIIPDRLRVHAAITDQVTFVGLGHKFQIWEPNHFQSYLHSGRDRLREMKKVLGESRAVSSGSGGVL